MQSNNLFDNFIKDSLEPSALIDDTVSIFFLYNCFKCWFKQNYPGMRRPQIIGFRHFIVKKYDTFDIQKNAIMSYRLKNPYDDELKSVE